MTERATNASGSEAFERHRDRLFGVAYRMTGSVADAEDCVQDAFLRWQRTDRSVVENAEAFLVRTVTRLAIDRQRSASRRRETYVGPWLPEPIIGGLPSSLPTDPEAMTDLTDSLSFAFLVLLDRLSPAERAAFILHDVFGVAFDEVAGTLDRSAEACRQLASRARRKVRTQRAPIVPPAISSIDHPEDPVGVGIDRRAAGDQVSGLLAALLTGDAAACVAILSPDVVLTSDAGPHRRAARRHVVGVDRVVRLLTNLANRHGAGVRNIATVSVNGSPGLVLDHVDGPIVITGNVGPAGTVDRVWILMNPDKLPGSIGDL